MDARVVFPTTSAGVGVIAGTVLTLLYFGKADEAEELRDAIRNKRDAGRGGRAGEQAATETQSFPVWLWEAK